MGNLSGSLYSLSSKNQISVGELSSFNIKDVNPYDLAMILDQYGICMRVGHLCTQPIMLKNNISSMSRISLYIYNDFSEIDFVVSKIRKAIDKL